MQVQQQLWTPRDGWKSKSGAMLGDAHLVIYFGGKGTLDSGERFAEMKSFYPKAHIMGCSTGGEIFGDEVVDGSVVVSALRFDKTTLKVHACSVGGAEESFNAGRSIAEALNAPDLSNIFVLSDGTNVNGSELVRGFYSVLDKKVLVTGGLAGDAADFGKTLVGMNEAPKVKQIVAVGFYGNTMQVGYGSVGGWEVFGPQRTITKSKGNVLFELDGQPALDLYKSYLGPEAEKLPGSALLFPLNIRPEKGSENTIIRTIVGVSEADKSMTFAGDVPEGYVAELMHGDFDRLAEGAKKAAELAKSHSTNSNSLSILVSCIGRKLLMGQSISDETEAVSDALGGKVPTMGFYSYGEICHQQFTNECVLHNQTMTVTVLHES